MQVDDPPLGKPTFGPIAPPTSTPSKGQSLTPIQASSPGVECVNIACAEAPKPKPLGMAIWQSPEGSPQDFYDRDFIADEKRNDPDEPLSPWHYFEKPTSSAPGQEVFATPQLVSAKHAITVHEKLSQKLCHAWLGTSVLSDPEWVAVGSKVRLTHEHARCPCLPY